jgi:hypothetical protein
VIENAGVEAGLVAEGGVEARRVDPQRFRDVRDADRIVASSMKEAAGSRNRLVGLETPRPTARAGCFCSHVYKKP